MNEASVVTSEHLLKALLQGRRIEVPVGRFTFTYERPPEMELQRMSSGIVVRIDLDLVQRKCVGWSGVMECDVIGPNGASDQAAPFSQALFAAWIADREDLWGEIAQKLKDAIEGHRQKIEALKGN